ncbi:MAG: hydantoinase/oxoprolinase family protein [Hyphomicrobiales bacterium]|nr:hydantoinase/oxoprolinase family protein [Hyphomicrobiales bacterium]
MTARARLDLGIDIGGTFTDFTLIDRASGAVHTHKRPSTPKAPSQAVARGIAELMEQLGRPPSAIGSFVHGTTIALNALLERRGAEVALLVTAGNRDILEIARLSRREKLNIKAAQPVALVPRRRVYEVPGRVDKDGEVVTSLSAQEAAQLVAAIAADGAESFAVCLINAHANAVHETALADALEQGGGGRPCSRSSELWPEIREYERAVVTVLNAYVQPLMSRYIDRLHRETADIGVDARLYITQSNGGVMSADTARRKPVNTLLSGPASGVVGAAYAGRLAGVTEAVTVDIGGTSADVSLIRGGEPAHSTEAAIGDLPVVMPSVDVFSVGAGGGSIARVDNFGLLKVGPASAGADPGPACYGLGGTEATVTDAYVVCGYVNPENFLGGAMKLDRVRAEQAVGSIADALGRSVEETAQDILDIATITMSTALLPLMTKRGVDPRDFTLIPFGGAGATHACLLSDDIRISRILVPPSPGTICALGAAIADVKADYIRSLRLRLDQADPAELRAVYTELEREARSWLRDDSPAVEGVAIQRSADMRYRGQAFTIEIAVPEAIRLPQLTIEMLAGLFHDRYHELYHNSFRDSAIELINLRVRVIGRRPPPRLRRVARAQGSDERPQPSGHRRMLYGRRPHDAAIYQRAALEAGHTLVGPALIEQLDTTTVVAPDRIARVDDYGLITITRRDGDLN